jgi:CDP-diacylglycerol---serine O-phosphatidyltransferase
MSKFKNIIPNLLTTLNLTAGITALSFLFYGNFGAALLLILFAALFDFLDGMFARILNAQSEFGKQLDSLADAVSFGLVPGFMMFLYLEIYLKINTSWPEQISYIGFILTVFAIYRLARFNSSENKSNNFTGLAVPAMALFISSFIWYLLNFNNAFTVWISQVPLLIAITVLFSVLMISRIPMFSLKFINLSFKGNELRYMFLIISTILLVIFRIFALPLVVSFYVVLSITMNLLRKKI